MVYIKCGEEELFKCDNIRSFNYEGDGKEHENAIASIQKFLQCDPIQ